MSLNKVMLIGNVGRDPEVRYLEGGAQNGQGNTKVASFTLATTERFRDRSGETRENTEWHNIVAWRNSADIAEKYIHKGTQIYVEGRLRTRQWTDQSGNKRSTTEVVVDNIQLLGRRPDAEQQGAGQSAYQQKAQANSFSQVPAASYQQSQAQSYQQSPAPSYPQMPVQAPSFQQSTPITMPMDDPADDLPF